MPGLSRRKAVATALWLLAAVCFPALQALELEAQTRLLPQPSHAVLPEPSGSSIMLDAANYPSLDAVKAACDAAAGKASRICVVDVRSRTPLQLSSIPYVPRDMRFRFEPGGVLELGAGTLDFSGGSIETAVVGAPMQIFAGAGKVAGLNEARPEWFVPATDGAVPATALAAAYAATVTWGTIRLSARSYVSPFTAIPRTDWPAPPSSVLQVPYDSPRSFIGSGRPVPDSDSAPTRLIGGSILLGPVMGNVPMIAEHLGVDNGPNAAAQYFGGWRGYGLVLASTGKLQGTGTRFEDLSVLTTNAVNQHSVMIEAQSFATVQGLWIWSLGGLHGLVIKSSHTTVDDFHCKGGGSDCLVIKSDFDTASAGYASDDTFNGVYISYLKTPGDTGGIAVDSSWDNVHDVTLSDVHLDGLNLGIYIFGSLVHTARNLHLDHWTATRMSGRCFDTLHTDHIDVSDFACSLVPAVVPAAFIVDGTAMRLSNIRLQCTGTAEACHDAHTSGVDIVSRGVQLQAIEGIHLGGALVRSAYPLSEGDRAQLRMSDMAGPLVAAYQAPHLSLLARLRLLKPPLRILYTYTLVRLSRYGIPVWLAVTTVSVVFLLMMFFLIRMRRSRHKPQR